MAVKHMRREVGCVLLCYFVHQELLPSMQDVYGVGLKEPKEQSKEGYDR